MALTYAIPAERPRISEDMVVARMAKPFGGLLPETERRHTMPIHSNPKINAIAKAWKKFRMNSYFLDEIRAATVAAIGDISCSAKELALFISLIQYFQDEDGFSGKAGHFLSMLINTGKDEKYVINTEHLAVPISDLGFENRKEVEVIGNLGWSTGCCMLGGRIVVHGNVGDFAARYMKGGEMLIHGNAGRGAGSHMENGVLRVGGDADKDAGDNMTGGMMIVSGNAGDGAGTWVSGGTLIIKGNAGESAGFRMQNGLVTIEGNCGDEPGAFMQGGTLAILGNAGKEVACAASGGVIRISGTCESIGGKFQPSVSVFVGGREIRPSQRW